MGSSGSQENKKLYKNMTTFTEILYPQYTQTFKIKKKIIEETSHFQKILIFDNEIFGRILVLDDIIQLTEKDHHAYTEMLVHFPILAKQKTKKVLIIGGGDGAIASEVLKHRQIKKIVLCEIDKRVLELSKKYLKKINFNSLLDSKIEVVIDNAANYISKNATNDYFDLIITDRPDPIGPGKKLFETNFYKNLKKILSKEGVVLFQTGVPFLQKKEFKQTLSNLKNIFKHSGVYYTIVPTYIGGHMALTWASNAVNINKKINIKKSNLYLRKISTRYYSPEIHNASLNLPLWLKELQTSI